MTTYLPNIPQPQDDPSQSQNEILENFQTINTSNSVNHVAFNNTDQGKHKFIQMPEVTAPDPIPTTAANEGALFTEVSNSLTELFWVPESNGTKIQLTNGSIDASASGYTFLPGNLLIQWGTAAGNSSATGFINTFPLTFLALRTVTCTPVNTGSLTNWNIYSQSNDGFKVKTSGAGPFTINYIAIGTY